MPSYRVEIDPKSVEAINRALQGIDRKLRNKAFRKGLKNWAGKVKRTIKSLIRWDDPSMKRSVYSKIKTFKRGRKMWLGVGIKEGSDYQTRSPYDDAGQRSILFENGFTVYPKGRPTNRTGRNWRKGLRKVGGPKVYQTKFLSVAQNLNVDRLPEEILKSIKEVIDAQAS